ncbi:sulfur carrier protein ThiS [Burkholderiales bacterium 23]|nr:sulfur carrier protein ThiS [Burkholderiales bacterium 23]
MQGRQARPCLRSNKPPVPAFRFPPAAMNITINQQATELSDGATVADALAQLAPRPPFAVAINTVFVPKARYAEQALNDGDRLEVISPVTGG